MRLSQSNNRAVSPVVAVVLLVAVSVGMSAVIGTFALDLGQSATGDAAGSTSSGVKTSQTNDSVSVTVVTSDEPLYYTVNGSDPKKIGGTGETVTLKEGTDYSTGDRVTILSGDGDDRSIVQTIDTRTATTSGSSGPSYPILVDDFEDGDVAEWTVNALPSDGSWEASTTYAREGSYSGKFVYSTTHHENQIIQGFPETSTSGNYSVWVYKANAPEDDVGVRWNSGSEFVFGFNLHREIDDNIYIVGNETGGSDTGVSVGSGWYRYDIYNVDYNTGDFDYRVSDSTGSTVVTGSHSFNATAFDSVNRSTIFGAKYNDNKGVFYFDNFNVTG